MQGFDLTTALTAFYQSVNVTLLVCLTGGAFGLHRLKIISAQVAVLLPLLLGGIMGALIAMGKVQAVQGGYIEDAQIAESVLEGFVFYGFGSVLLGRGVSMALDKMGIWPTDGQPPPTPPDSVA